MNDKLRAGIEAVRVRLHDINNEIAETKGRIDPVLGDAETLLGVLWRIVTDGWTPVRAFGAPGDWGYGTDLGEGVWELHHPPPPSPRDPVSLQIGDGKPLPPALSPAAWSEAKDHLDNVIRQYGKIPAESSMPALTLFLLPLRARFERGERTEEIYAEMMATE